SSKMYVPGASPTPGRAIGVLTVRYTVPAGLVRCAPTDDVASTPNIAAPHVNRTNLRLNMTLSSFCVRHPVNGDSCHSWLRSVGLHAERRERTRKTGTRGHRPSKAR